jgi:ABC-type phosphate transport system substrate-binding protein
MKVWSMSILAFCLSVTCGPQPVVFADDLVFIVHATNPVSEISTAELRDYYFKKKRQWPDGGGVRFIDRSTDSEIRKTFLQTVLKKTTAETDLYWIGQKLYSGDSAPLQESSDRMVMQFVTAFPGAIGYVSSSVLLTSKDIKPIKIK